MPSRQGVGTGWMQKMSGSGMQANPVPQVGLFVTAVEVLQGRRVGSMGRPAVAVVGGGASRLLVGSLKGGFLGLVHTVCGSAEIRAVMAKVITAMVDLKDIFRVSLQLGQGCTEMLGLGVGLFD